MRAESGATATLIHDLKELVQGEGGGAGAGGRGVGRVLSGVDAGRGFRSMQRGLLDDAAGDRAGISRGGRSERGAGAEDGCADGADGESASGVGAVLAGAGNNCGGMGALGLGSECGLCCIRIC